MDGIVQIELSDMLRAYDNDEDKVKEILSSFSCPRNSDVEDFFRNKAIMLSKQDVTRTYLVYMSYRGENVLVGYYALTQKAVEVQKDGLSKNLRKELSRYGREGRSDINSKSFVVLMTLLAQFSKNYTNDYGDLIKGDELMQLAVEQVKEGQRILGGRFMYLECEDKDGLVAFYKRHGFREFGRRLLDRDERENQYGNYYLQMLRRVE